MSSDHSNLRWYVDLTDPNYTDLIGTTLKEHGLCTFDAPLSEAELVELAKKIGTIVYHPDADEMGVMHIWPDEEKVDTASAIGGAFTRAPLPLHTDGKGVTEASETLRDGTVRKGAADFFVFQAVLVEDPENAVPVFCDGHTLYEYLEKNEPELFAFLNSPNAITRYTTQPNYSYSGPLFEKTNGGIAIRFNIDESRDWQEGYLKRFLNAAEILSFEMQLRTGQGYIIDNRRMMHGRSEIKKDSQRKANHILVYTDKQTPIGKHLPIYSL